MRADRAGGDACLVTAIIFSCCGDPMSLYEFEGKRPSIDPKAFVHPDAVGSPARVIKEIGPRQLEQIAEGRRIYQELARRYLKSFKKIDP